MPLTTSGLIQFVLANASPSVRWQTSFELCSDRHCLLQNLVWYSSQSRRTFRRLYILKNNINSFNAKIIWPKKFRHEKHEKEVQQYVSSSIKRYREVRRRSVSLSLLMELLKSRIKRFSTGLQSHLTQDFYQDMLMLIQEKQVVMPVKIPAKKSKSKKSKSKAKKKKEDDVKDEL